MNADKLYSELSYRSDTDGNDELLKLGYVDGKGKTTQTGTEFMNDYVANKRNQIIQAVSKKGKISEIDLREEVKLVGTVILAILDNMVAENILTRTVEDYTNYYTVT